MNQNLNQLINHKIKLYQDKQNHFYLIYQMKKKKIKIEKLT